MGFEKSSKDRWNDLIKRAGSSQNSDNIYNFLNRKYSEPKRKYHNFDHVKNCLYHLDKVKDLLEFEVSVEFAIWFHDVIYKTRSGTNEEDSAVYAKKTLSDLGVENGIVKKVHDLIIATKHDGVVYDLDSKYLIDIDLSILGANKDDFLQYEKNIRKEYSWVPYFFYKKKRFEVLKSFLERKFIYGTDFFRERYELKARSNLNFVLKTYRKIYPD